VWWNTLILGWVQGFLTGYNYYGPETSDITKDADAERVARWVDDYCLHHPVDNIAGATEALVNDLLSHRAETNYMAPPIPHNKEQAANPQSCSG
jgi:hypothetical protein